MTLQRAIAVHLWRIFLPDRVSCRDSASGDFDWLALAGVGDPDRTYLQCIVVSPGVITATRAVSMPTADGDDEFGLFENTQAETTRRVLLLPMGRS